MPSSKIIMKKLASLKSLRFTGLDDGSLSTVAQQLPECLQSFTLDISGCHVTDKGSRLKLFEPLKHAADEARRWHGRRFVLLEEAESGSG